MPSRPGSLLLVLCLALAVPAAPARAQLELADDPAIDPADFTITVFASGLSFPYGMLRLEDGSLLVATSSTTATSGTFWAAPARLVRLVDADDDGVADAPPSVVFSGLPARASSLARVGALIVVVTAKEDQGRLTFLRPGPTPADPLTLAGRIDLTFPNHVYHQTYAVAARPSPSRPGAWDVVFNIGSKGNDVATTTTVGVGGLVTGVALPDSLVMVTVVDDGTAVTADSLVQLAAGLRNAAGLAFDPASGDLYLQDNGIDTPANPNEPLSADELDVIRHADLGGTVEHFGFPDAYVAYRTGVHVGPAAVPPLVAFQPIPDPMTGAESEGAAQIALSPPVFPPPFDHGIFVGFHGRFTLGGAANEENPIVFYDLDTGDYLHFTPPGSPGVGHPDGLHASGDSLFIADFSSSGGFAGASGVIYRVRNARTTCAATPACLAAPDTSVVWGVVRGRDGLGSIRCVLRPGLPSACDTDPSGHLVVGPPMCGP